MDVSRSANEPRPASVSSSGSNAGGILSKIFAVLVSLAAFVVVIYILNAGFSALTAGTAVKSKEFQAVFLTNGQVYFGKLSSITSGYVKLTNIYYLQVQQAVQPSANKDAASNQQVSLAKLGGELHGPEDVMYISRSQVLFWENLKTDGKVAKAIQDYVAAGNK